MGFKYVEALRPALQHLSVTVIERKRNVRHTEVKPLS